MELTVAIPVFEGPLDLLLHLLDKNKVSIYDIPIVIITDQYLEYLEEMHNRDLDLMSEFLLMAATLIEIKAKMLLPTEEAEEEAEDPREELIQQLLEYKMYKSISGELRERMELAGKALYKLPTIPEEVLEYEQPVDTEKLLSELTLARLERVFRSVMRRQENRVDPLRSKFGKIEKEEISLEDTAAYLEDYAATHRTFRLQGLLEKVDSKIAVVVTFLAVLELMKLGKIGVSQEETFDDIEIRYLGV